MNVIGIDPGLRFTGYACVAISDPDHATFVARESVGTHVGGGGIELVEAGVIRLRSAASISSRLVELFDDLTPIFDRLAPAHIAVEKLYAHYKHPTTAAIMGHARGVVLLAIARSGAALIELGATEVKKSLTGHGHASKSQVQHAVAAQLGLATIPEPADIADAIAVALCAARRLTQHAPLL